MANAAWLFGLTLHQLNRPGAPFVSAGFIVQVMGMRTSLGVYSGPESQFACGAAGELAHGSGAFRGSAWR